MRILSWNINGLRAIIKNRGFGTLTRLLKFLQAGATHSPPHYSAWHRNYKTYICICLLCPMLWLESKAH